MERRLSAIFAADVVGYSRLMEADEVGTIARQRAHRRELINPAFKKYRGRVVKEMGDGILVEFPSAINAVRCALAIQKMMPEREALVPLDSRIAYRIGVNLGDIVVEGDDILGGGVNIAARLEQLADPGGVCISQQVFSEVEGKLKLQVADQGDRFLKNITKPVHVYKLTAGYAHSAITNVQQGAGTIRPSIAVLPFDNMSNDPDQEFVADGLTEDIITALSKVTEMSVIARNSTFAYKGRQTDIREIARELGVRYVLEGSLRRVGTRIRVTAQLIGAADGNHVWAERYDREFVDIFDLQDEITGEVCTALQMRLTEGDQVRTRRQQTRNVNAWEKYAQGQACLRRFNKQDNTEARELLHQAVEFDNNFAAAWCLLSWIYYLDARNGWAVSIEDTLDQATGFARRSLEIDAENPDVYAILGAILLKQRKYDDAISAGHKSIERGPRVADSYAFLAMSLCYAGEAHQALGLVEQAMRLCPYYPDWYLGIMGVVYRNLGRFDDAIAADLKRLERNPANTFSDFRLAAVYEEIGRHEEAKKHVSEAIRKNPAWNLRQISVGEPYRDPDVLERYLGLLRNAGMPE